MARQRDFAAEYARRLELGRQRGESRTQARGHRATPERPIGALRDPARYSAAIRRRFDFYEALASTPLGRTALARFNLRRQRAGLPVIVIGRPPDPGPGERQGTTGSLEEAERHTQIGTTDPKYVRIYLSPEGYTWSISPAETRRRRRAA